tara:strand:- start:2756 stop:2890 length:135 start_codon:yes stop_codon:yes gene_type:complete
MEEPVVVKLDPSENKLTDIDKQFVILENQRREVREQTKEIEDNG